MEAETEKLNLYIRIKWWVLLATAVLVGSEAMLGVVGIVAASSTFAALSLAACLNLWLNPTIKKEKALTPIAYLSMSFDLLIIILALYFNGGIENTWLFFPAIIIFLSGYLFTLRASLFYAAASFFAIFTMFILEYFRIIPHFSLYGFPELYWRNLSYSIDYLIGMFLLYFFAAFTSGYANQIMSQASTRLEKSLAEVQAAQKETENSRRALMNLTEDLIRSKEKLEARVSERTAELEEAKSDLEKKVAGRTADLEKSRKAILHMMKDLKEDIHKLQMVDRLKTEFLSITSHELKSPLTPIYDYADILQKEMLGPINEKQKNALGIVKKQCEHLMKIIESILEASRIEHGKPIKLEKEPVSFKLLLEDIVKVMRSQFDAHQIKLETDLPEDFPTLLADPAKLRHLMTCLLENALKFTPKGGGVKVWGARKDDSVEIQVVDNGIGLAREHLEKIFTRFFQVDTSYTRIAGGVGLGLTIAKEIVEAHSGRIWAESEGLGKGSTFFFTIPLTRLSI